MYCDSRLKTQISDVCNGIDVIRKLRPVSFHYRPELSQKYGNGLEFGFLAQEVSSVVPDLVRESQLEQVDNVSFRSLYLNTNGILTLLTSAVKDIDSRVDGKHICYKNETASIQSNTINLNGFKIGKYVSQIRGPLFASESGFQPYTLSIGTTAPIVNAAAKIRALTPIINNGVPCLVPDQVQQHIPEAVYILDEKKCLDPMVIIAYLVAAYKNT